MMVSLFASFRYVITRILRIVPYRITYYCFRVWMLCSKRGLATGGGERWAASDWDEIAGVNEFHHLGHVYRYIWAANTIENGKVLDLGCGTGYGSYYLSKFCKEVVGLDIATEAIEWAITHFSLRNIKYVVGNAEAMNFKDKEFDTVVCFETIEHLRYPELALKEIQRICKGKLLISTPVADKTSLRIKGLIRRRRFDRYPFHLREYTIKEFKDILSKYFVNIKMYGQYVKDTETMGDWINLEKRPVHITEFEMNLDKMLQSECIVVICEPKGD